MTSKIQFKISSALKNIIGKELITDELIAVFELVKNSYDAHAKRVDINIDKHKIFIKDNGKGMDIGDITNKWLFVGYSAKADGSEDKNLDYRDKIHRRKSFAGAKGIGRFACDRLGKKLELIAVKKNKSSKIEKIEVDWNLFEEDAKKEFVKINANHSTLNKGNYKKFDHGTILEISELRNEWTKDGIEKLKQSLAKLINPEKDGNNDFVIYVNGEKVENFVFEKLSKKTTQIITKISSDGKFIITELIDRGERIYKIKEKNKEEWEKTLFDIEFNLFHLNLPAKLFFHKMMGMPSVEFGSVFLYKNGFRVYPYGEEGEDTLKIDRRKQQGMARFLGSRDLIGNIRINNESNEFKETSSRDGGLIGTQAYRDLRSCFIEKCLRRFELYVVEAMNWTFRGRTLEDGVVILPEQKIEEIKNMITKLTKVKDFVDIDYSYVLLDKIGEKAKKGLPGELDEFRKEADKSKNEKLIKQSDDIYKKFSKLSRAKDEAESEKDRLEEKVGRKDRQVSSLMEMTNQEFKNIISYHHQISISSDTIKTYIERAVKHVRDKKYEKVEEVLMKMKKENDKISSISGFASKKSGMSQGAVKQNAMLSKFIEDYLLSDCYLTDGFKMEVKNEVVNESVTPFRTFEITMILDNLLNNSKKASAKKVDIIMENSKNNITLEYIDNGKGIDKTFLDNPEEIFDPKVTTTDGAGWGLFYVKEILEKMNSNIMVVPIKKGIKFLITFNK